MEALAASHRYEENLAARAQTDQASFAAVYDHFFRRVYNYVRYRVGDPASADDVTAQIFERALNHLSEYHSNRGSFAAWLFGIARHAVQDHLRKRRRNPHVPLESVEDRLSDAAGPDQHVEAKQDREYLLGLIASLNEREKEILALKFGASLTNRRIAELIGLKESHVGVILYRTMGKLREKLQGDENGRRILGRSI